MIRTIGILLSLALAASAAQITYASSCAMATTEHAYPEAALLPSAKVMSVEYDHPRNPMFETDEHYNECVSKIVTFKVIQKLE